MPFRKKGSSLWHYDFQIRGRRFRGSCGTADFETAKAVEAAERVSARRGTTTRAQYTLSQALGTYWSEVCQHQSSAATATSQARAILAVLPGTTLLAELTNQDVLRFVQRRRAQVSNATVNRQLQMLGRALRHMERFHAAEIPPLELRAAQTREPEERIRELTQAEQDALMHHLRPDLVPVVKFALMTGARRGSIAALKWTDIDKDAARLRFDLKGGFQGTFPINAELRALLGAQPRATTLPHAHHVFTTIDQAAGARRDPVLIRKRLTKGGSLWEDWREAVTRAGLADLRFHDLRHTFATRMLRATGNLKLVSRLLHHRTLETTMRYAHVLDDDLATAMAGYRAFSAPESRRKSRSEGLS